MVDCTVVHACTGLGDVPDAFVDSWSLPNMNPEALFSRMDKNETLRLTWNFDYFRGKSEKKYREFVALEYGYYFAVLRDQLLAAARNDTRAPKLTIDVMSDTNIIPLLAMYGLSSSAEHRPPYLSALVHEVYEERATGELFVRVLYNGYDKRVCPSNASFPLCPLSEWDEVISRFIPTRRECRPLYEAYHFLGEVPGKPLTKMEVMDDFLAEHRLPVGLAALALLLLACRGCRGCKRRDKVDAREAGEESSAAYVTLA